MASAFWYLEDGRCFSNRWSGMFHMLELINNEIKLMPGGIEFSEYLNYYIWDERADEYNGYGGFIRTSTNENVMLDIDLREFTPENRAYFWKGAQEALRKLITSEDELNKGMIFIFTVLLDMHKRIKLGEKPELLNHSREIEPHSNERKGPGWK